MPLPASGAQVEAGVGGHAARDRARAQRAALAARRGAGCSAVGGGRRRRLAVGASAVAAASCLCLGGRAGVASDRDLLALGADERDRRAELGRLAVPTRIFSSTPSS